MTSAWTIRSNPAPLQWTHTPQMMSGVCYSQVCVPPSTGLRLCDLEDKRAASGLFLTLLQPVAPLSSLAVCVNVTEQWGGGGGGWGSNLFIEFDYSVKITSVN